MLRRHFTLGHSDLEFRSEQLVMEPKPQTQARPHQWAKSFNWFL